MDDSKFEKINQQLASILTPETILGRVYQLYLIDEQEMGLRYFGSTTRTLDARFAEHKRAFNQRKDKQVIQGGISSYKLFQKGFDKVHIRQLYCGLFPSLQALKREEDRWVTSKTCVNKIRPLRSLKQQQMNRQYYQNVTKPKKQKQKQIKKEEKIKTYTPLQMKKKLYNRRTYEKNLLIFVQCPMCFNTLRKAHMPEHKKRLCRNRRQAEEPQTLRQSDEENQLDQEEEDTERLNDFDEEEEGEEEESSGDEGHQMPSEVKG